MMKKNKDRFTTKIFAGLWIPALISSVGWALSDMADAVVVGQKLGVTGMAAIGLILPVYMVNCMFAHGFGTGGAVGFSEMLAKGRREEAVSSFRSVMAAALTLSLFTAVFGNMLIDPILKILGTEPGDGMLFFATKDYLRILISATPLFYISNILNYFLRNDENQKLAGIGSVIGNISDIVMNIVLVLFCDMGMRGAALSTVIGQLISIAIYSVAFFEGHSTLSISRGAVNLKYGFRCFFDGFATSVQYLYQLIFLLLMNNILIRIGGENGVAVFDLVQNTSYLILYLYEGTARGMQPVLSTYQGERDEAGKRKTMLIGILGGSLVGCAVILCIVAAPSLMCRLFGIDGSGVQEMAYSALRIYGISAAFAGLNILISNYYQSCGMEKIAFLIQTLRGVVLLIPFTLIFSAGGTETLWWLFPASELSTFLIYLLLKYTKVIKIKKFDSSRVFQCLITDRDMQELLGEIEVFCDKWSVSERKKYFAIMAVEEICVLIINNGFKDKKTGYIQITMVAEEDGGFELHIRDNATEFNPFEVDSQNNAQENGMDETGILLIKKKSKEFFYRRYHGFNTMNVII